MKPQLPDHLKRLLDLFEIQFRSPDEIWPEVSKLSQEDLKLLADFLRQDADPWDKGAALAFLAMSQSEAADRALRSALESTDVRLAASALTAVAEIWPDTRFQPIVRRYVRSTADAADFCVAAALALYRMGEQEGFDVLARLAIGDGTEKHDSPLRLSASSYLASYTRDEDRAALVPLVGMGVYFYVAFSLIEREGQELASTLRQQFSYAQQKVYVAFTLCQLGDRDAFEYTKRILLTYDEKTDCDYPIIWAVDALICLYTIRYKPWGSEDLCPFFLDLLVQQMRRPDGGHFILIERVVGELERFRCTGDSCRQLLTHVQAHVEPNTHWPDKEKTRVLKRVTLVQKKLV